MRRASVIACAVLLILIGALIWWVERDSPPPPPVIAAAQPAPSASPPASPSASRPADGRFVPNEHNSSRAEPTPDGKLIVTEIAETARRLYAADAEPQEDLEVLQSLLTFYRRANGGANPGGSENEEIVDQLRGKNARRLAVLPPGLPGIDTRGQLLDRWNTPYFFHAVSRTVLGIRSAGPDRKLWTDDDLVNEDDASAASSE